MSSYRWVADNYEDGDRIFLFGENILDISLFLSSLTCSIGFSRGAYQVRALAGMIDKVGAHRLLDDVPYYMFYRWGSYTKETRNKFHCTCWQ